MYVLPVCVCVLGVFSLRRGICLEKLVFHNAQVVIATHTGTVPPILPHTVAVRQAWLLTGFFIANSIQISIQFYGLPLLSPLKPPKFAYELKIPPSHPLLLHPRIPPSKKKPPQGAKANATLLLPFLFLFHFFFALFFFLNKHNF